MRTLRASEISAYLYCQRAWWYQKHGRPSANQTEMAAGSELHYRHGRAALTTGCVRSIACALILVALALVTVYLTGQFF
jgi:hypothetical protein